MEKELETQIQKSIGYWCFKLTWRHRAGDDARLFYPWQADLETVCWTKVLKPETTFLLETIWSSPDPNRGGIHGISKFISVLCSNACKDEHRRLSTKSSEIYALELDSPSVLSDGDGGFKEGGTLAEVLTDETVGETPTLLLSDLNGDFTSEEREVLSLCLHHGYTMREIGPQLGLSKSAIDRIKQSAIEKIKTAVSQHEERRPLLGVRLNQRTKLNPARIPRENLEYWAPKFASVPYFDCQHLSENGGTGFQDFDIGGGVSQPGRFALCAVCWGAYWASVCEQLDRAGEELLWEKATEGLATPGTNACQGPLFIDEGKEKV